jgi:DNA-damage-inducible protein J
MYIMAQVNVRMDDSLKEKADSVFNELGLTMTTAFNITTHVDPFYSASNMDVLRQSIKEANEGKLTEHELIED